MYFLITAVVLATSVVNLKKIYETHEMLYRLEHWDELDDSEKEAMETLKFIEKAHDLLHQHDHLGLGDGEEHEHDDHDSPEGDESPAESPEPGNYELDENQEEIAKIEIEGGEEGGFMAIAADPDGAQEAFKNEVGDSNGEGPALGFDLEALAGSGTVTDELRRIYNYMSQVNHQYRCPQDQIKFIGTDKKYFMDFSYPICFEREKFWKPSADHGCLVYSFGVDNKWSFTDGMIDQKCEVHAFDPNMYEEEEGERDNGVKFHKVGIGSRSADGVLQPGKRDYEFRKKFPESKLDLMRTQPMRTLWGIMRELEHTDRIIDVVKIDREGPRKAYEPAVIRNLLEDGTYSCIRQLVFELHFFGPMTDPDEIRSLFSMLKGLENVGLKLFRSQQSKTKTKLESVDDFLTLQNEKNTFMYVLSWLNPNPTICH